MNKPCSSLDYTVTEESFESMRAFQAVESRSLAPPSVFVTPVWLEAWWRSFGEGAALALLAVRCEGSVTGLAPLLIRGDTAAFIGSPDVCDYLDFCVISGEEQRFFAAVLYHLFQNGVSKLELHSLRPDSAALAGLAQAMEEPAIKTALTRETISVELALPGSWDQYLALLTKKQRHEVRRKLRRLEEAGPYRYRAVEGEEAVSFIPHFLEMFKKNPEKANFLTGKMEIFFTAAIKAAAQSGLARFGLLELAGRVAAAVFYFDYCGGIYLYNSAYDPDFGPFSAGLLCKVLSIKDAVERGRVRYDFLKGGEVYKHRLGGREIPIYHCTVTRPG